MGTTRTMATIESFLAEIQPATKVAAENHSEPGGYHGPTTHPIKNVPDNTIPATTGARAAENERDVKEEQKAPAVDATPTAKASGSTTASSAKSVRKFMDSGHHASL